MFENIAAEPVFFSFAIALLVTGAVARLLVGLAGCWICAEIGTVQMPRENIHF